MRQLFYFISETTADSLAKGGPGAEVVGGNAVLEEEEVVPLWGAVVLRLGCPEKPALAHLVSVHLGADELAQEVLVFLWKVLKSLL